MSFKVKFNVNGGFVGNVRANENMKFKELINLFLQDNGFNEYHKAIFSFHSKKINRNLVKNLKELGIKANSVIEVKNQNLLNISNNTGNMENYQIPQNINTFMDKNMNNNYYIMFQNLNNNSNSNMNPFMNFGFMNMGQIMNNYGNMCMNPIGLNYQKTNYTNFDGKCDYLNIIFYVQGRTINVQGCANDKFCDIASKFSIKAGISEIPYFILNSRLVHNTETKTLKELGLHNQSCLETIFYSQVIGA